jgi:adenylate cyclase
MTMLRTAFVFVSGLHLLTALPRLVRLYIFFILKMCCVTLYKAPSSKPLHPRLGAKAHRGVERRLTTIFYADAAWFSRLMTRPEAGVFPRPTHACRIMEDLLARHYGRQVNSWGDAVIAEFASVVEAVRCAVEIWEALGRAPDGDAPPSADRMRFCIGVNLGDVLADGDTLYGDGVNVAARRQDLAKPGGVAICATVHERMRKRLSVEFRHPGPHVVKST